MDPDRGKVPFTTFCDQFLDGLAHLSLGGYRNIEIAVRLHIKPYFEGETVAGITPAQVRSWIKQLRTRGMSPAYIATIHRAFKRIMATAVIDGLRQASPCVGITLPKNEEVREEPVYLTPQQVQALADAIEPRYSALIVFGAYAGLRIGEMIALLVEDCHLDGDRPYVIVRASQEDLGSKPRRKTTKNDRIRRVDLPVPVAQTLAAHTAHFPSADGSHVFSSATGKAINRRNYYNRHFKPAVKAAGLPARTRIHDLRHTCASFQVNGRSCIWCIIGEVV